MTTISPLPTKEHALKKIDIIWPGIPAAEKKIMSDVLQGHSVLKQADMDDTQAHRELVKKLELRLNSLDCLAKDQVNYIMGSSTLEAFEKLGAMYGLGFVYEEPIIGSSFMRAILDGQRKYKEPIPEVHSYDWLKHQVENADYGERPKAFTGKHEGRAWETSPMLFNVIGIQGYMIKQGVVPNQPNVWNDVIALAWIDEGGQKQTKFFVASTDPGSYYFRNPVNSGGTAHLALGQYRMEKGPHNGHPAFIQGGNMLLWRANKGTKYLDINTPMEEGRYNWINNHAGFAWTPETLVEWSSAGCQVILAAGWNDWRWLDYYRTLKQNARNWHWYTLLSGAKLAV